MKDETLIPDAEGVMGRQDILKMRLAELRRQHRELDDQISAIGRAEAADSFSLRRLKKQKLALKDQIARIEDQITPDIIA
ncbi:MAG: YdcH family protein [Pseudomonadota bacterium]